MASASATEHLCELSRNYTKLLPGVDLEETPRHTSESESESLYRSFVVGGGDAFDSTAKRLSDIMRPHKVGGKSDFSVSGGGSESGGEAMNTGGDTARTRSAVSASTTLDPMECFDTSSSKPSNRYATMIQTFFLMYRMLECFPDCEGPLDAIAERVILISDAIKAKAKAANSAGNRAKTRSLKNVILQGSGMVDIDHLRQLGALVEGDWMLELEEFLEYFQSSDLWNGPTRADVKIYLTTEFVQECRLCSEERKKRTIGAHSFFMNHCDHLPACRAEQFGGGTLPIRRYIFVMKTTGWTQRQLDIRMRLVLWCIQNKLVGRDYGAYRVHPTTCSTYMEENKKADEDDEVSKTPFFPQYEGGLIKHLWDKGTLPFGPPIEPQNHVFVDDSDLWYKTKKDEWKPMLDIYCSFNGLADLKSEWAIEDVLSNAMVYVFQRKEVETIEQLMKEEGYSAPPFEYRERSSVSLIDSNSFLCSPEYLRDWPMLWKQHLPHYHAFVSSGIRCMFPGFFGVSSTFEEAQESTIQASRTQVRQMPSGSTTVHYRDDYKVFMPTISFQQRMVYGPKIEELKNRAFMSDSLRPDFGVPKLLHQLLQRTMQYTERHFFLMQYLLTMRSDEANASDALRDIYSRGGKSDYNPIHFMSDDSGPLPYHSNLSPFCNFHIKFLNELRHYYQIDAYKVTFVYDFYRMLQDCFREKRTLHNNVVVFTEEKPGVGKSFLMGILSQLLLSGAIREVGHQSEGHYRQQMLGRMNDSIIVRDEATKSIFMSKSEGGMADPRIKGLLTSGYIKSDILNWNVNATTTHAPPSSYQPSYDTPSGPKTPKRKAMEAPAKKTRKKKRKVNDDSREFMEDPERRSTSPAEQRRNPTAPSQQPYAISPFLNQSHGSATDRKTVNYVYEEIGSWFVTTNFNTAPGCIKDQAMSSRTHTHPMTRSAHSEDGIRMPLSGIISKVPMAVRNQKRALQMAHMEIQKMIIIGAMKEPNLHMVHIVKSLLLPILSKHFIEPPCLERDFDRVSALTTTDCITRVVFTHFFLKGGMYYSKSITPTRLRSLEPFMYATFQDVVFAFGNFSSQIVPNVERYMLTVLRKIWCSSDKRENPFTWKSARTKEGLLRGHRRMTPCATTGCDIQGSLSTINSYGVDDPAEAVKAMNEDSYTMHAQEEYSSVDYNYIVFKSHSQSDPVPEFAKVLHHEISMLMKENKVENMSIPEVKEVENWLRARVLKAVPDAKRMVSTGPPNHQQSRPDPPIKKKARKNRRHIFADELDLEDLRREFHSMNECHMKCIKPDPGAILHDIKCLIVEPKVGLFISTYWLSTYMSVHDDIYRLFNDVHEHNIKYSMDGETVDGVSKVYHDLLLGSPDPMRSGKYEALGPAADPEDLTDPSISNMGIPKNYCPDSSIRVPSLHNVPPRMEARYHAFPRQSLDEIVQRTHVKEILIPGTAMNDAPLAADESVLSNLDFLLSISFLVMDSQENRRAVLGAVSGCKAEPTSQSMVYFVDQVKDYIPTSTLFSWFFRTTISVPVLRRLFPMYYYILMTAPCFRLETVSGIVRLTMASIENNEFMDTTTDSLFNNSFGFANHFYQLLHIELPIPTRDFSLHRNMFSDFFLFPAAAPVDVARGYNVPGSRCRKYMHYTQDIGLPPSPNPYTVSYDNHFQTMTLDPSPESSMVLDTDVYKPAPTITYQEYISLCISLASENSIHSDPMARKTTKYPTACI